MYQGKFKMEPKTNNLFYSQMLNHTDVDFDTLVKCGIKLHINKQNNKFVRAIDIRQVTSTALIDKTFVNLSQKERINYAVKYMLGLYIDFAKAYAIDNNIAIEKTLKVIRFRLWQADMDRDAEEIIANAALLMQTNILKNIKRQIKNINQNII